MIRAQTKSPLPTFSRADAENLVRQAAEAYKLEQSESNREVLRKAVQDLGEFDPPIEEWIGWAPHADARPADSEHLSQEILGRGHELATNEISF